MNEATWWLLGIGALWAIACYNWYRHGVRSGKRIMAQTTYEVPYYRPWLVRDQTGRHIDYWVESEARAKEMARQCQACDPLAKWVVMEVRK